MFFRQDSKTIESIVKRYPGKNGELAWAARLVPILKPILKKLQTFKENMARTHTHNP